MILRLLATDLKTRAGRILKLKHGITLSVHALLYAVTISTVAEKIIDRRKSIAGHFFYAKMMLLTRKFIECIADVA